MVNLLNRDEIKRAYALLFEPGQVVEVRALKATLSSGSSSFTATYGGYFNSVDDLLSGLAQIKKAKGIYVTLQRCKSDLIHRTYNELVKQDSGAATSDKDITGYRWLLIDSDPIRSVSDISSTGFEHANALAHSRSIATDLAAQGWPAPILADSGNGGHLLYRIDLAIEDKELVERVLKGLATRYDLPDVTVDQTVFNPARICKLYGTLVCKGANTPERHHRMSHLLEIPQQFDVVGRDLLEQVAVSQPVPQAQNSQYNTRAAGSHAKLSSAQEFLDKHHIRYKEEQGRDYTKLILTDGCVFDPSHKGKDAAIIIRPDSWGYNCFHNGCSGKEWKDFRAVFEPDAFVRKQKPPTPTPVPKPVVDNGDLPEIIISGQLRDIYGEALEALRQGEMQNPTIFVQSGRIVQLVYSEKKQPIVKPMGIAEMRNALTRTANYFRPRKAKEGFELSPVSPPKELAESILALDPSEWPFPPLKNVVEMPIMRQNGTILDSPGYDRQTELYYAGSDHMKACKISQRPTVAEIEKAKATIDTCIGEFPYESQSDRANAYGLLLTLVTRYMYMSDVQTALINATKQGTGKTLLAQVACIIATGRLPALTGFPSKEEETKKVIDAKVLAGVSLIVFDNIKRTFASTSLDQLTTGGGWYSVRPLGQSKDIPVEVQCTVIATGNNMQLDTDMARRCFQIRLVSPTSNPDERDDITVKELIEHTIEHRGELVAALLTLARAWFVAGKKPGTNKLARAASSFTHWAKAVGGILENAGIEGFQENRDELKSSANTEEQQIAAFLHAWFVEFGNAYIPASNVVKIIKSSGSMEEGTGGHPLYETLPDHLKTAFFEKERSMQSCTVMFTKWLVKRVKTPFGSENILVDFRIDTVKCQKEWHVCTGGTGYTGGQRGLYAREKNSEISSIIPYSEQPTQSPVPPVPPVPPGDDLMPDGQGNLSSLASLKTEFRHIYDQLGKALKDEKQKKQIAPLGKLYFGGKSSGIEADTFSVKIVMEKLQEIYRKGEIRLLEYAIEEMKSFLGRVEVSTR